jgi:putative ABC transport system permease protein
MNALRSAVRSLAAARGFTTVAVLTIALGVGATTGIFSLVRGVLLRELPFPESHRLVAVWEKAPQGRNDRNVVNPGNYLNWRERARSFSTLTALTPWTTTFAPGAAGGATTEGAERLPAALVGPGFFETFGVKALVGRTFLAEESTDGHDEVVVLSESFWRRRFAGDPTVLGKKLTLEGTTVTVVGVVGGLEIPPGAELWAPIGFGPAHRDSRGRWLGVIGRLAPGVTLGGATAEMTALAAVLASERPEFNAGWGANVVPLQENFVGGFRLALWVLLGAVGSLLLVACANLANLWLARAVGRDREMAVRSALGAGASDLARQTLTEALLVGVAGGALGLVVARATLSGLLSIAPTDLPRFLRVDVDLGAGLFAAALTLATALLVAWLPARRAARTDAAGVLAAAGARGYTGSGRAARLLVVVEVALALVLVLVATLLGRSLGRLQAVDPGFVEAGRLVTQLSLPGAGYREPARQSALFERLVERVATLPGVENAAVISWLPLGGSGSATNFRRLDMPPPTPGEEPVADIRIVSPTLFETLRIPLQRGRGFDARDEASAPLKAVIRRSRPGGRDARDLLGRRPPCRDRRRGRRRTVVDARRRAAADHLLAAGADAELLHDAGDRERRWRGGQGSLGAGAALGARRTRRLAGAVSVAHARGGGWRRAQAAAFPEFPGWGVRALGVALGGLRRLRSGVLSRGRQAARDRRPHGLGRSALGRVARRARRRCAAGPPRRDAGFARRPGARAHAAQSVVRDRPLRRRRHGAGQRRAAVCDATGVRSAGVASLARRAGDRAATGLGLRR